METFCNRSHPRSPRLPRARSRLVRATTAEASDGRMDSQSLYSVVAHNRFIEDLTEKAGRFWVETR